ncbi:hypothetical protein NRY68_16255 [Acidithiobacillus ferrooxidans]|uniref:hypothetical protein n=1 Tax=Acidithiobacillus ferrooxidans TaxID=920 RepID=UPI00214928BA|nr:hypothetical protein [Acidithiobacillus ferrooxidans]MCR1347303.1 hypothetical protein [Acidithiobacillus ferrooxidans]MCR1354836.1 hypothetical protein [Acidithiobacillus ferrooxidans]
MTIVDMSGITETRMLPLPRRSTEDWYQLACKIAKSFGAQLHHEAHGGARADFREDSPSLVIWQTGFWYDHRGGERGGATTLMQHLQEVRGLVPDARQGDLSEAEWLALSTGRCNARSRSTLSPAQAELRWSQLDWGTASRGHVSGCRVPTDADREISLEQQATVLDYLRGRGLSTQWCRSGIIGTRLLQDTEIERKQQDQGADFLFGIPYWPFAHFLPGTREHPNVDRMCGMQRTFLAHATDDYHPVRKTGRAMMGPAGMTRIDVPANPDPQGRGWGASDTTILQLLAQGKKLIFYSEGLESGIAVAQQTGGILHVLWSTSGYKNLAEAILDLDAESMPLAGCNPLPGCNPPADPDEVHILLVDRDKNREGEKAAAYLGRTLEAIGRRVLYLLPLPPSAIAATLQPSAALQSAALYPRDSEVANDNCWFGDWDDVLTEGRMDAVLQQAILDAAENLRHAPLHTPEDIASGEALRSIPVVLRPQLKAIHEVRIKMDMREYLRKHMDASNLQGVWTNVDSTGAGKTRMLARLPAPEGDKDHTVISTPQRRDTHRIIDTNRDQDGTYYLRNSRTNSIADESDVKNLILDRLDAIDGKPRWTRDSDFITDADAIRQQIADNTLPGCWRSKLQSGVQMDLIGALSQENGEMHPDILTHQHHGCGKDCATCPAGCVAQILVHALQKPDEAETILEELDAPVKNLGPYQVHGQNIVITKATLGQFLPCASQLNRLLSYAEKAVCTTTALLQYDKRLFSQATEIRQDEMPTLMDSQEIGWKVFQEARAATDYWINSMRFQLAQTPDTPENQKLRKTLQQSIASTEKVMLTYRFLYRHFLDVMADEKPMSAEGLTAYINTKKVQRKIVQPFLKSIRAQKIQHEAMFEQPYFPSADSRKKIVPTVFAKHLAQALEHGSLFFIEGADGSIADRKILLYFPTAFGEELILSHAGESKKRIDIYTATPDMVLTEMSKGVSENFAEDFVHLVWRPMNHTKTAQIMNPATSLQSAQRVLLTYWEQGLKTTMLVNKKMAPALQAWAKQYRPGYENLIGWIGKHHVGHNDWADCDGLVIWSLDLPPIQVLAQEYLAARRIFGRDQWADLNEFSNHWESSRKDYVAFPHLGLEALARVFANADFDRYVRWRVTQTITQANGRLRGVNNPLGETRKKFCDVYSEIPPIDGLFGTYVDDIIPAEFLSPEVLHKQAVERLANVMSGYQINVPVSDGSPIQGELMKTRTIRMSIRDLQKTAKTHGLSGFQSENLREALELLKQSRPDVLDYKIRPGRATEIIVRADPPIPAPEQPTDDRVIQLLGHLIRQRQEAGGGEIQFSARELYRILEPHASQTPGLLNLQAVYDRLQQAFPDIEVEERNADTLEPWTYIRFRPDTPAQLLGNTGYSGVGGVYNNSVPPQRCPGLADGEGLADGSPAHGECLADGSPDPADGVCPADSDGLAGGSPADGECLAIPHTPKTLRNGDVLTLQIQGTRVKAFSGVIDAPGGLIGDPEPSRVFPAFVPDNFIQRLMQREGQWRRECGGDAIPNFVHRIGLDYRKEWVRWFNVPEHPVIETLAILTHHVDSYLTLQHPECLSVLPALDAAENDLAHQLAEDPLLQALLENWRAHPGIPRLDLRKPLHITSSLYRSVQAENSGSG